MLTSSSVLRNRFLPLVGRSFLIEYLYGSKNSPHMGTYEAPLTYLKTVLLCASADPHDTQWNNTNNDNNIKNSDYSSVNSNKCEFYAVDRETNKYDNSYRLDGGNTGRNNQLDDNSLNKKRQREIRRRRWREKYGEESWLMGHINRRQRRNLRCMIEGLLPSNTAQDHLLQQQLIYYVNSLTNEVISNSTSNTTDSSMRNGDIMEKKDSTDTNVNMNQSYSSIELINANNVTDNISNNDNENIRSDANNYDSSNNDEVEETDNSFPHSIYPNEEYDEDEDDEEDIKVMSEPQTNATNTTLDKYNKNNNQHNNTTSSTSELEEESLAVGKNNQFQESHHNNREEHEEEQEEEIISSDLSMPSAFPWNTWLDVIAQYINTSLSHSLEVWTARVLLYDTIWTWLLGSLEKISMEISSKAAKEMSNMTHHQSNNNNSCNTENNPDNSSSRTISHNDNPVIMMMSNSRGALIDKLYGASETLSVDEECLCYLRQIRENERISLVATHIGLSSAVRNAIEELIMHELILSIHKSKVLRLRVTKYDALRSKVHNNTDNKLTTEESNINNNNDSSGKGVKSNDGKHAIEINVRDLKRAIKHYRKK